MICPRCGHQNQPQARFCSSCGTPRPEDADEATLTLSAVEAAEDEDDLSRFLEGLPDGLGLMVLRQGPEVGASFRLESDLTAIGRHPDSDVFLDDITVSRRHVSIERGSDGYVLSDCGSLNGTYVNRERVERAVLHHGDEVQIGRYRLTFVLGGHERG